MRGEDVSEIHGYLARENAELRARLAELEGALDAIRNGAADALVVEGENGKQLFTRFSAERSYRNLVEDMGEGAITLAADGTILYCNQRFAEMLKTAIEKVIGSPITAWVALTDRKVLQALLQKGKHERCRGELSLKARDETLHPAQFTISTFQLEKELDCFCVTVTDLTQQRKSGTDLLIKLRKRLEYERYLAQTDFLTGIFNRRAFDHALSREIRRAGRYHRVFSIAYIDLDNFKSINDQLGHLAGDCLLKTVATIMGREIRTADIAARLGGDEFAILFPETDQRSAKVVMERLQQALLCSMAQQKWPVTFSIGVLTCEHAQASQEEIMSLADGLMYSVKTKSKNAVTYAMYSDSLTSR